MLGRRLRVMNRLKSMVQYERTKGDVRWTYKRVCYFPALCIFAGVMAGLLGIGGGIIKGPILLIGMGLLPDVQSATTAFMILFTSSATTLQFAIAGQYPGEHQLMYISWHVFIGFLGAVVGRKVRKHGRFCSEPSSQIYFRVSDMHYGNPIEDRLLY